jgi:hypothetical protein
MLLGFRDDTFKVGGWSMGDFCLSAAVLHRSTKMKWRFMLVYGPADHSRTEEFLCEFLREVQASSLPIVVGGDFNLIRGARDKNNDYINWSRVRRFNDVIASLALREIV